MSNMVALKVSTLLVATMMLATSSASAEGACPPVLGAYGAVSESEWDLQVILKKGGSAEVVEISWIAGESEKADTKRTRATWRFAANCVIELNYQGILDRFTYTDSLTLESLGDEGGAPGLLQLTPYHPKSKLRGVPIWKLPHKFGAQR
jgi:hypothetical protein